MTAFERFAVASLALVLVVIFASAAIRLGPSLDVSSIGAVRMLHRIAASLEVLTMIGLGWIAWRARARQPAIAGGAAAAAAITLFLSVLGIAVGQKPPLAAAVANLLGGLALGAVFAWVLGRGQRAPVERRRPLGNAIAALILLQCALGAWVSIVAGDLWTAPLFAHAFLGTALATAAAWFALRCNRALHRFGLLGLALLTPAEIGRASCRERV